MATSWDDMGGFDIDWSKFYFGSDITRYGMVSRKVENNPNLLRAVRWVAGLGAHDCFDYETYEGLIQNDLGFNEEGTKKVFHLSPNSLSDFEVIPSDNHASMLDEENEVNRAILYDKYDNIVWLFATSVNPNYVPHEDYDHRKINPYPIQMSSRIRGDPKILKLNKTELTDNRWTLRDCYRRWAKGNPQRLMFHYNPKPTNRVFAYNYSKGFMGDAE